MVEVIKGGVRQSFERSIPVDEIKGNLESLYLLKITHYLYDRKHLSLRSKSCTVQQTSVHSRI